MATEVWVLLDAMDRFQRVFGNLTRAKNHLSIKYGEVEYKLARDGLCTRIATCPDGTVYRIECHTPN